MFYILKNFLDNVKILCNSICQIKYPYMSFPLNTGSWNWFRIQLIFLSNFANF